MVFTALTFAFPFYTGDWMKDATPDHIELNGGRTILITIISILAGGLAFAAIFLFGNRKFQLQLSIVGLIFAIGMTALYIMEVQNFSIGTISLWCIFPFAVAACYVLAIKGIRKDEKLVKSLDRLR